MERDFNIIKEQYEYEKNRNKYKDNTQNFFDFKIKFNFFLSKLCPDCKTTNKIYESKNFVACDNENCGAYIDINDEYNIIDEITDLFNNFDIIFENENKEIDYENNIYKIMIKSHYCIMNTGIHFEENELSSTPHNNFLYYVLVFDDKKKRDSFYDTINKNDFSNFRDIFLEE